MVVTALPVEHREHHRVVDGRAASVDERGDPRGRRRESTTQPAGPPAQPTSERSVGWPAFAGTPRAAQTRVAGDVQRPRRSRRRPAAARSSVRRRAGRPTSSRSGCDHRLDVAAHRAGRRRRTRVTPGAVRGRDRPAAVDLRLAVGPVAHRRPARAERPADAPRPCSAGVLASGRRRRPARPRTATAAPTRSARRRSRYGPSSGGSHGPRAVALAHRPQPQALPALDDLAVPVADVDVVDVGVAVAAAARPRRSARSLGAPVGRRRPGRSARRRPAAASRPARSTWMPCISASRAPGSPSSSSAGRNPANQRRRVVGRHLGVARRRAADPVVADAAAGTARPGTAARRTGPRPGPAAPAAAPSPDRRPAVRPASGRCAVAQPGPEVVGREAGLARCGSPRPTVAVAGDQRGDPDRGACRRGGTTIGRRNSASSMHRHAGRARSAAVRDLGHRLHARAPPGTAGRRRAGGRRGRGRLPAVSSTSATSSTPG